MRLPFVVHHTRTRVAGEFASATETASLDYLKIAAPLASMRREVAGITHGVLACCQPHRHSAQLCRGPATAIFHWPTLLLTNAVHGHKLMTICLAHVAKLLLVVS